MRRPGRRAGRRAPALSACRGSDAAPWLSRRRPARRAPSARAARPRGPPSARAGARRARPSEPLIRGRPSSAAYNRAMADENLLKRYAELVVRVGANVQEGQDVGISTHVEQAPFARALATAAYEAGAHYVNAQYHDQFIKRELIIHGD